MLLFLISYYPTHYWFDSFQNLSFYSSMLCLCNFLCVVCDAFLWASQLKRHYLCPEIRNNSDFFFHGDDNDDDDDDWYYYLIFLIIFHFICLFWPVVQTRHNFNSSQCTCQGKYCFLNLFLVVGLLVFSNVACRSIVKCEIIVNKWEKKPGF